MDLLKVADIEDAQQVLFECLKDFSKKTKQISSQNALSHVLAEDIYVQENIPSFRRSTVDGYAVVAADVAAASESIPVFLENAGSVDMGKAPAANVTTGKCVYVPTGGAVPDGADAMVMIEFTEKVGESRISISESVAKGKGIIKVGEDVTPGTLVAKAGTSITPQIIGVLSASGFDAVPVYEKLKIAIISTGDELVPVESTPDIGQIRDVNTYSISAQAQKNGYDVVSSQVIKDDRALILKTVMSLKEKADIICISGGSSQGEKDYTSSIINEAGDPGTIIHGVAVKPGKPTIIGYDKQTKTIMTGLPGHPVSAFIIFELLFSSLIRKYTGAEQPKPYFARISQNLPGSPGRTTCVPVRLTQENDGYKAEPVFGKSGLISTLSRADGYVVIDKNKEGLQEGENVTVYTI